MTAAGVPELSSEEADALSDGLARAGVALAGPLVAEALAGGRSNRTYRLSDGRHAWVARLPPRAGRTPSAHDVAREYRVTAALWGTDVPVARPVAANADDSAAGGAYAVWEFVEGRTVRSAADLDALPDAEVAASCHSLVGTLATLHRVDHVAVGLEDFGRPTGYAERQLARWSGQWELVGAAPLASLAGEVVSKLSASVPEQRSVSVVHGDYRLDNTILAPQAPRVVAVVDWELSTIGDPVADVAMMCAYRLPALDLIAGEASAWTSGSLPDIGALASSYEAAGGVTLNDWDFHLGLAYFKVAVIAAGIDHRFRAGAVSGPGFDTSGRAVEPFLRAAAESLRARS